MRKMVGPSKLSNYPELLQLISRCREHYQKTSQKLRVIEHGARLLHSDEQLFLDMVHRFRGDRTDDSTQSPAPTMQGTKKSPPKHESENGPIGRVKT